MKRALLQLFAVMGCLLTAFSAQAQLRVEISGVGANQIPVSIAIFADDSAAGQSVSAVIKADLQRSGLFRLVDTPEILSETAPVNLSSWKAKGADALVTGSVLRLGDGRFEVRYKLMDTIKGSELSALSLALQPQFIRMGAHRLADDIFEKLTGIRGAFATRIAYIVKSGTEYRLEVADSDGENPVAAIRSSEPLISPVWSPDGSKLAYVSFENKKPVVYVQELASRRRIMVANFKGSNSAPAWSPDGKKIALALARDGLTQVYVINADGSDLKRLTQTAGIDTEPRFAPDGQTLYFTSDRSGGPQIYRMNADGGDAKRVTFNGTYNISPRISPDGKMLAYVARRDGRFQLFLLDLASGQELRLSEGARDESPSFSPNGKYLMFATESGGRGTLAVVSTDGRTRYSLTARAGAIREPTWGPFTK
jgi:TolB protein